MPIPLFKMNQNDPTTWGEIEGTQEQNKRRFVTFKGTTTGTTPGEIFLDGIANYRLKVHDTSTMSVRWVGASLGTTAALSSRASGEVGVGNFAGTTALIGAAAVTVLGALSASEIYAFTADDTNDALILTVTPGTGTTGTKYWEVQCWVTEVSADTGQQV